MKTFLLTANTICEGEGQRNRPLSDNDAGAFATAYNEILCEGERINPEALDVPGKKGQHKQPIAGNLLRRMRQNSDAVLLLIRDPSAPSNNNVAERAVCMPKVKQKISGCLRTLGGAENFCSIRSCLDTLRKQGYGMLDVLRTIRLTKKRDEFISTKIQIFFIRYIILMINASSLYISPDCGETIRKSHLHSMSCGDPYKLGRFRV